MRSFSCCRAANIRRNGPSSVPRRRGRLKGRGSDHPPAVRPCDRSGVPSVKQAKRPKKTRAQKSEEARAALFQAAAEIVSEYGYVDASISRITQHANLAQGTFYNYFTSRQDIFDQPRFRLPAPRDAGRYPERAIMGRTFLEREELAFRAFFDFLKKAPYFLRILNEVEISVLRGVSAAFAQRLHQLCPISAGRAQTRRNSPFARTRNGSTGGCHDGRARLSWFALRQTERERAPCRKTCRAPIRTL